MPPGCRVPLSTTPRHLAGRRPPANTVGKPRFSHCSLRALSVLGFGSIQRRGCFAKSTVSREASGNNRRARPLTNPAIIDRPAGGNKAFVRAPTGAGRIAYKEPDLQAFGKAVRPTAHRLLLEGALFVQPLGGERKALRMLVTIIGANLMAIHGTTATGRHRCHHADGKRTSAGCGV